MYGRHNTLILAQIERKEKVSRKHYVTAIVFENDLEMKIIYVELQKEHDK